MSLPGLPPRAARGAHGASTGKQLEDSDVLCKHRVAFIIQALTDPITKLLDKNPNLDGLMSSSARALSNPTRPGLREGVVHLIDTICLWKVKDIP